MVDSTKDTATYIDENFDSWFIPALSDFVRIPNLTLMVDKEYSTNGLIERAIDEVHDYITKLNVDRLTRTIFKPEGRNPLIVYIIEPENMTDKTRNIMMYGHLDKQPWGEGWLEGLHPTDPVIRGDLMYGRGASDDGYAPFACLMAIKACQQAGVELPRIAVVLESEEESGSPNLTFLLEYAEATIKKPDCLFCMDSGCLDYDQFWMTSSLRGICIVDVTVEVSNNGYHSGAVGGIIPESFRIMRTLLNRLDDPETGLVTKELHVPVPEIKKKEATFIAAKYGAHLYNQYSLAEGLKVMEQDNLEQLYLNNVWNPNLSITGMEGVPPLTKAGNVLRQSTTVRCSMRLPPAMSGPEANRIMEEKLSTNVPYNAKVTIHGGHCGSGWCMKDLEPWLEQAIQEAGIKYFDGKPTGSYGEGGSIPFLKELQDKYPDTQIVAFGVLGPNSNAHGPNEMINLPYTKRVIKCLTHVLGQCAKST